MGDNHKFWNCIIADHAAAQRYGAASSEIVAPCPFCGEPAELDAYQGFRHYRDGALLSRVSVDCASCGAAISNYPGDVGLDHESAIEMTVAAWNARVVVPDLLAVCGEALKLLESDDVQLWCKVPAILRKAIARATGEA